MNTPTPSSQSPQDRIVEIHYSLPTEVCVDLTRRLLASVSCHSTREVYQRAVLKNVIFFGVGLDRQARRRLKAALLQRWRCPRQDGNFQFFIQYGVKICLMKETKLRSYQIFTLPNYFCDGTDRPVQRRQSEPRSQGLSIWLCTRLWSKMCCGQHQVRSVCKQINNSPPSLWVSLRKEYEMKGHADKCHAFALEWPCKW